MSQNKMTRKQKIKKSQRLQEISGSAKSVNDAEPKIEKERVVTAQGAAFGWETYQIVSAEIRRISVISLICFGLLAVATLLISDLSPIEGFRQTLGLPSLF